MIDNFNSASHTKLAVSGSYSTLEKTSQKSDITQQNQQSPAGGDQVTISYESTSVQTYDFNLSLEQNAGDGLDLLRGLVLNIFKEQGLDYTIDTGDTVVDITTITPEEAQELVADDGYFGVEKTSERIFNFAVGIAGGDPGRIDAIKQGIEEGFQEALEAFGGELPDISYDTYDAAMKKLDEWAGIETSPES